VSGEQDELAQRLRILEREHRDLQQAYAAMQAHEQIRACVYRFCRALDRLDRDLLATVFHPDAEFDYGSIYRGGLSGFLDVAMRFQGAMRDTHHNVGNVLIELDGLRAGVESYVQAHHVIEEHGGLLELVVGARYLDRFECRDGRWRVAYRTEVLDWARQVPITDTWFEEQRHMCTGVRDDTDPSYALLARRGAR